MASLYKLLEQEPTVKGRGPQTLLRSESALTSCLQPNGNPEGINTKDTGIECSENEPYPAPSSHRRSTGSGKNGWGSRQPCCTQQRGISGFQDCWTQLLRPDWLQMQTEHTTVTTTKAVRMMQSQHYRYAFQHRCGTPRQGVLKDTVVS